MNRRGRVELPGDFSSSSPYHSSEYEDTIGYEGDEGDELGEVEDYGNEIEDYYVNEYEEIEDVDPFRDIGSAVATPRSLETVKQELGHKQALLDCLPPEETDPIDLEILQAEILSLQDELNSLTMEHYNDARLAEILQDFNNQNYQPAPPPYNPTTPDNDTFRKRGFSQVDHSPTDNRDLERLRRFAPSSFHNPPPVPRPPLGYARPGSSQPTAFGSHPALEQIAGPSNPKSVLDRRQQTNSDEQIALSFQNPPIIDLTGDDDDLIETRPVVHGYGPASGNYVQSPNSSQFSHSYPRVKLEPRNSTPRTFGDWGVVQQEIGNSFAPNFPQPNLSGLPPSGAYIPLGVMNNPLIIDDGDDDLYELPRGFGQQTYPQFHQAFPQGFPYHYAVRPSEPAVKDDHEQVSKLLEHLADDAENRPPSDRLQTPKELKIKLMEHQKIGLTWLVKQEESSNKGGILADDMGLGKTIQALSLIIHKKSGRESHKTTLIVCPVALMAQWQREIEVKVRNEYALSTYIYHGQQPKRYKDFNALKKFDVVLTSYGTVAGEYKKKVQWKEQGRVQFSTTEFPFLSNESTWYRVILDESQHVKNHRTLTSKACAELMATYRLCLSGTPMQNSIDDLFGAARFLHLPRYKEFRQWNQDFGQKFKLGRAFAKDAMHRLQTLLKAIMLRRKKDSTIDGKPLLVLPEKHIELVHPIFSEDENELYQAVEQKVTLRFNKYLESGSVSRNYTYVLLLLLRLRQVCCHPKMIKDLSMKITEEEKAHQTGLMNTMSEEVINRLKNEAVGACPICFEADPLIKIILPCGHYLCQECLTLMSTHAQQAAMADGDDGHQLKCPHCRGPLDTSRVIDLQVFQSVHMQEQDDLMGEIESLENQLNNALGGDLSSDSNDSGSEDEDESSDDGSDPGGFIVNDDDDDDEPEGDALSSGDEVSALRLGTLRHSPAPPRRAKLQDSPVYNGKVKKEEADEEEEEEDLFAIRHPRTNSAHRKTKIEDTDDDNAQEEENLPSDIFELFKKENKDEPDDKPFTFADDEVPIPKPKKKVVKKVVGKGKGKKSVGKAVKAKKKKVPKKKDPNRRKTLSDSRAEAMRNKKARKKYFRDLAKNWTTSAKIEKVREIIRNVQDNHPEEKTIIFCSFTSFLDLLQVPLQRVDKVDFERYDGSMSAKDRNDAILNFTENPSIKVMLVSLKAGNSGLNLTAASHVIIIDPWWNPYVEEQAIDRAHRIGQTRQVYVHRLIIRDTVEDRILTLQDQKREVISAAMDEEARKNISKLSVSDMIYLFTGSR
ncbi:hypothetical protein H072_4696 [Dactylellina haptotyla CBS 200.50]|uniref:RING-type domain-containing protein n=1 Tax=Dactylellina haptotyla (strain CBS 200.50) TaxID=1284197 RepID=S8BPM6_DACHA|nr:hypothetical protein H072_4696 [Dactylellina haptotyla CBS 200.50]